MSLFDRMSTTTILAARDRRIAELEAENARLRADLDRALAPWKVQICLPDEIDINLHTDCEIVDIGYSDRVIIVECKEVNERLAALLPQKGKGGEG